MPILAKCFVLFALLLAVLFFGILVIDISNLFPESELRERIFNVSGALLCSLVGLALLGAVLHMVFSL